MTNTIISGLVLHNRKKHQIELAKPDIGCSLEWFKMWSSIVDEIYKTKPGQIQRELESINDDEFLYFKCLKNPSFLGGCLIQKDNRCAFVGINVVGRLWMTLKNRT